MTTRILLLACGLMAAANLSAQGTAKSSTKTIYEFKAARLETPINGPTSDFAPVQYGERIYFTSTRQSETGAAPISQIFSFTPGETPTLDKELNPKKTTNHIASTALMPDASRMYFTLCHDEGMQECEIWYREKEYEGTWGVPAKLPDFINLRNANNTQPSIGFDASQKKYVLYFASNRKGGKGKMDIWASTITWDGKFEEPTCLPFNTPEDEVTPSYNQTAQTLYFSSNGLKGAGRFDVFSTKKDKSGTWGKALNMGRPFNTAYDDLFYTYHEASQTGYLASDRPGSLCNGSVEGFNCFDIYELKKTGITTNFDTKQMPSKN